MPTATSRPTRARLSPRTIQSRLGRLNPALMLTLKYCNHHEDDPSGRAFQNGPRCAEVRTHSRLKFSTSRRPRSPTSTVREIAIWGRSANQKSARMTGSWTTLVSSDEAARRAAGRRRINAERHRRAELRRDQVVRMVIERGGLEHGIRAAIARELGVSRSTISRDIAATIYAPREPRPKDPGPAPAELIAALGPLGERLAAQDCECGSEDREEPRHALGHVLKLAAETLDAMEEGRLTLPPEEVRLLERIRDQVIDLLRRDL